MEKVRNISLCQLPNELLTQIIECIPLVQDPLDGYAYKWKLCALSVCSKRLHYLVEPTLYSSFKETNERSLLRFLCTILTYPERAQYVTKFEARDTRVYYDDAMALFPHVEDQAEKKDMLEMIKSSVNKVAKDSGEAELWHGDINKGFWDAVLALTLRLLPKVEVLCLSILGLTDEEYDQIDEGDDGDVDVEDRKNDEDEEPNSFGKLTYPWLGRMFRRAALLQQQATPAEANLENLRTIELLPWDTTKAGLAMSQLIPFASLPSVQNLRLTGLRTECWHLKPPQFPTLDLQIYHPRMHAQNAVFLECFPHLERFERVHTQHRASDTASVVRALHSCKSSLREVVLSGGIRTIDSDVRDDARTSFVDFEILEVLDLMDNQLYAWAPHGPQSESYGTRHWDSIMEFATLGQILHYSVREMTLRACRHNTVDQVGKLLEWKEMGLGKLETLTLHFNKFCRPDTVEEKLSQYRKRALACGVKFWTLWDEPTVWDSSHISE